MENATVFGHFLIHVPHSGILVPEAERAHYLISPAALWREQCLMTDAYCDELYLPEADADWQPSAAVVAEVSRVVCDVERFRDDADEPCAKLGQGLMYTRTTFGRRLRPNDPALREHILETYYDPHHVRLTAAVDAALEGTGRCTILDGHSFHSVWPPRRDCLFDRPDVCIGTDAYHTPDDLRDALVECVRDAGLYVRVNTPYSGAITPLKYYGRDKRVSSVMIELNRRLYLHERTMEKTENFAAARALCQKLVRIAAEWAPARTDSTEADKTRPCSDASEGIS